MANTKKPFATLLDKTVHSRLRTFCDRTEEKVYVVVQRAITRELDRADKEAS